MERKEFLSKFNLPQKGIIMKWNYVVLFLLCTVNLQAMNKEEKKEVSEGNHSETASHLACQYLIKSKDIIVRSLERTSNLASLWKMIANLGEIEKTIAEQDQKINQELPETLEDQTEVQSIIKNHEDILKILEKEYKVTLDYMKEKIEHIKQDLGNSDEIEHDLDDSSSSDSDDE